MPSSTVLHATRNGAVPMDPAYAGSRINFRVQCQRAQPPHTSGGRTIPPAGFYRFRLALDKSTRQRSEALPGSDDSHYSGMFGSGGKVTACTRLEEPLLAFCESGARGQRMLVQTAAGTSRARKCGLCVMHRVNATHCCVACAENLCEDCANVHTRCVSQPLSFCVKYNYIKHAGVCSPVVLSCAVLCTKVRVLHCTKVCVLHGTV